MNKLLTLLTATLLVASLATVVVAVTNGPEEVKFTPKMGTVTFNHTAHQGLTDCATCHHTGDYAQCNSCHDVAQNAPKVKDAFHKLCKDCHVEQNNGPTKCKECHVK